MISWNGSLPWIIGLSALAFVASIVVAGVMIVKIPVDFLTRSETPKAQFLVDHPLLNNIVWILKNLVGLLLLIAGVVMLLTPGQGLLFILLGLSLLEFPGKQKLLRQLIQRRGALKTINRIRERAGSPPLEDASQNLSHE